MEDILISYDTDDRQRVYISQTGTKQIQKPDVESEIFGERNAESEKLEQLYPVVIFQTEHYRRVCIRSKIAPPEAFGKITDGESVELDYFYSLQILQKKCLEIVDLYKKGYVFDNSSRRTTNSRFGLRITGDTLDFVIRDSGNPRFWSDTVGGAIKRTVFRSEFVIPLETLHRIDSFLADHVVS